MGFHMFPLCKRLPKRVSKWVSGLHLSSQEDPFGDYASVDTEHALADERVFGVLKLTKLAASLGVNGVKGLVHHLGRFAQL